MTDRVAFRIGDWVISPDRNIISAEETTRTLEPKVMSLLLVLCDADCKVVSRADIEEDIWGQIVVGEDTVARLISKLRKAFGDTAQDPKYFETISKKGYRLMLEPHPLDVPDRPKSRPKWFSPGIASLALIALALSMFLLRPENKTPETAVPELARADDLYMNFTYADNETAIKLYEQVLAMDSENARAQSGLANALVQRVIRWPDGRTDTKQGAESLTDALALDLHKTEFGQMTLERAASLAERSARLEPKNADTLKALGLTYAAQGRLVDAKAAYEKAITLDEMAWESMVNLGEIYLMKDDSDLALEYFIRAYEVMDKSYVVEPQKVGQWQSQLGTSIADLKLQKSELGDAEIWFRRVLSISPLDKEASIGLAAILRVNGDAVQADAICRELEGRLGKVPEC